MASDISGYTDLKTIVSYFLDERGKSISDMDRCWLLALRGLVKLNYAFAAEPKTLRIPKNGNQTVTIPPDCLMWTKIGVLNENGEVATVKVNNSLTTWNDQHPNRISNLTPDIHNGVGQVASAPFYSNYFYNGAYRNLYGLGGGLIQYGECRVDERNGIVVLNPQFRYDSIIFEYISSPERDNDYQVPTYLQEAIIAFVAWKLKLDSRENFYAEAIEARRSSPKKKVTLQEINQVIRESNSMKLRS